MNRLDEDRPVVVTLPSSLPLGGSTFECHVLAIVGRTVALEPFERSAISRLPAVVHNVLMTFRHGESLVGIKGGLVSEPGDNQLKFLANAAEGTQRARPTRVAVDRPCS